MNLWLTIGLLLVSNVFMTFAWYGHLKFKAAPLWEVILISWLIAFLEYCFQVPANRIGSYEFSAAQLKIMQEVITLLVFGVFSVWYLKQHFTWNYVLAFTCMIGAVFFVFSGPFKEKISFMPSRVTTAHSVEQVDTVRQVETVREKVGVEQASEEKVSI